VVPFVFMVATVGVLIMLEPDLGTAVMIALITGSLFFVAGAKLIHVFTLVTSTALVGAALIVTGGYRMDRILSFTSAEDDPSGFGFQTLQLLVAFGSGGIGGLGLGVSRQKFFYVPGSHTDGVFAIIGEEIGFIGVTVVLGLFVVLLWRGLQIVRRAPDKFGSLLATGVLAWIAFQLILNVGGVTRSLPLTGIPLPLLRSASKARRLDWLRISYGEPLVMISASAPISRAASAVPACQISSHNARPSLMPPISMVFASSPARK